MALQRKSSGSTVATSTDKRATTMTTIPNEEEEDEENRRGRCRRCFDTIWRRTDYDQTTQPKLFVQETFKELIIYCFFLMIVCIITFSMISTNMYYYTKVMMDLFLDKEADSGVSFRTITSMKDFWDFAMGPLINGLYWNKWYNSHVLPTELKGYIYYENKLIGVPRIRQLRVHSNSCAVVEEFDDVIPDCYSTYSAHNEDREPFGEGVESSNETSKAWNYQSAEDLGSWTMYGNMGVWYSGGGYIQDLTLEKSASNDTLHNLFMKKWIQRGARVVFVSFTVYNANINLFCVITLVVEFPPTGGALPYWTFETVKLIRYVTTWDHVVFGCEIVFFVFILYYSIEEMLEICEHGCSYFKDYWNLFDIAIILMAITILIYNVLRRGLVQPKLDEVTESSDKYINFQNVGFVEKVFNNIQAIMVFLAWVKVFKFISFNKTMTQLSTTLSRCAKDLMGFFLMFFIVFQAFTQLGYLLFGAQVKSFSTIIDSFFTLFRIILGDFDFYGLEQANRLLGPIYFMLFVFFVFFVLINMFLAIINDTYSEVKSDMSTAEETFIMADYLKEKYQNIIGCCCSALKNKQRLSAFSKLGKKKKANYEEVKDNLVKKGYRAVDVHAAFLNYQIDKNSEIEPDTVSKVEEELERQRTLENQGTTNITSFNDAPIEDNSDDDQEEKLDDERDSIKILEFMALLKRVDQLEGTLGSVITNIDTVLDKVSPPED